MQEQEQVCLFASVVQQECIHNGGAVLAAALLLQTIHNIFLMKTEIFL